jgi:hypothetical protein
MRFTNDATNPDFYLFVNDLNVLDPMQQQVVRGQRLNSETQMAFHPV